MGVKFLSEEWTQAVQEALNANEGFRSSVGSLAAKVHRKGVVPARASSSR